MSDDTINGIPRIDPRGAKAAWKRGLAKITATTAGAAVHRRIAAPLDAAVMRLTGGRVNLAGGALPLVVLTSTGARSGQTRHTPLAYFTDGDDVILIASNYGGRRHPGWYHNLRAHPSCELHIGARGGAFSARETDGADRDRLFTLAVALYPGYGRYAERTSDIRAIRLLRLSAR